MSFAKDGTSVTASRVARYECAKCGNFYTSRWPENDREIQEVIREHMNNKHGGPYDYRQTH